MLYKNMEIWNAAQLYETQGAAHWLRVPQQVMEKMEMPNAPRMCRGATGVELRFIMKSDTVTLRLQAENGEALNSFHIYRGGLQGGWDDHELNRYVSCQPGDFVIKRSANMPILQRMAKECGDGWNPEVVRVIFDRGIYGILDVQGELEPPQKCDMPARTLLCYGSSITHGSNSIDASHAWPAMVAHGLKMDCRNLGMAGCCALEPAVADYVAGQAENWDIAVLELGINVLGWEESKIAQRSEYFINTVAAANPQKPVYVISPFYCCDDFCKEGKAQRWRRVLEQTVARLQLHNVTYINGLQLLGDMTLISADEVHPNIYGVQQIAQRLLTRLAGDGVTG